jgi:hypothetical protein
MRHGGTHTRPGEDTRILDRWTKLVGKQALDPQAHGQLADLYARHKHWVPAIAEYRSSIALGNTDPRIMLSLAHAYLGFGQLDLAISASQNIGPEIAGNELSQEVEELLQAAKTAESRPLSNLDHNRYYRMKTLTDHLLQLFPNSNFRMLDVGGGDGAFALFVPEASYVLADPKTNGISGTDLPFAGKTFDVVVACHVLEHIPQNERVQFLDQLCTKARKYVLLLNPFFDPASHVTERLQLVVELTDATWAKEHLAHQLPELEELKQFASERGLRCRIWPNGSLPTTMAMVFIDHYATLAGCQQEVEKINHFFNCHFAEKLTNPELPTDYLVELRLN